MKLSDLEILLPQKTPDPTVKPMWGTVTQANPLRVMLDGDSSEVPVTPATLVSGLAEGHRVWCVLAGRQLVIIGKESGDGLPVGAITPFAGSSAPDGWLTCDGSSFSASDYPQLAAVIGTTYGGTASNPYTPNLSGRVAVGLNTGQTEFNSLGKTGGERTHTLTVGEMPTHNHTTRTWGTAVGDITMGSGSNFMRHTSVGAATTYDIVSTDSGSGNAHNNLQPYLTMNYIIKAM